MIDLELKSFERAALRRLGKQTDEARVLRRTQALLWLDAGESVADVAAHAAVRRQSIYNWVSAFVQRADLPILQRVSDHIRSGRPRTVWGVIDPLLDAVIERDPREFGYRATTWTAPLLISYLADAHQIAAGTTSVHEALQRLRVGWKRPRHVLALRSDTWRQSKGGSNTACFHAPAQSS